MPASTVTSGVGLGSAGPVALAVDDAGKATVWTFAQGAWTATTSLDVDDFAPDDPIQVADATGDGTDDFLVTWTPNHHWAIAIVGDGGTWRAPTFQFPASNWTSKEPAGSVGSLEVSHGTLWSTSNPCIPDCATADQVQLSWRLDGDHFVVTNPEAVKDIDESKPSVPTTTAPKGTGAVGIDQATVTVDWGTRRANGNIAAPQYLVKVTATWLAGPNEANARLHWFIDGQPVQQTGGYDYVTTHAAIPGSSTTAAAYLPVKASGTYTADVEPIIT
jgi:hypothetical protein